MKAFNWGRGGFLQLQMASPSLLKPETWQLPGWNRIGAVPESLNLTYKQEKERGGGWA